jgi:hypothetical protein
MEKTMRRYSDEKLRLQRVKGIGENKLLWTWFISYDIFSLSFIDIFLALFWWRTKQKHKMLQS